MPVMVKIHDPRIKELVYQTNHSSGIDLHACITAPIIIRPGDPAILIDTGISIWSGASSAFFDDQLLGSFIFPRSGLGHKKGLVLGNTVGVIDADYQGKIFVSAFNRNPPVKLTHLRGATVENNSDNIYIEPMERIAQLVFMPINRPEFQYVDEFPGETERGAGGFGSTGTK